MTDHTLRSFINLVESATQANLEDLEKLVVSLVRDHLASEQNDGNNSEWVADWIYDQLDTNPELKNMAQALNMQDRVSNHKWISTVFRKHMGKSMHEFELAAQREHHKTSLANATDQQKKLLKVMGNAMTARLSPRDVQNLAWYQHSPQKIVVLMPDNLGLPAVVLGTKTAQGMGLTDLQALKDFLTDMGIKQQAKPKAKKSTPSYYD